MIRLRARAATFGDDSVTGASPRPDGNARLNLATFVTTYMDPEAEKLMAETFDKNMIDKDEYPQTAAIEERCVNIVSRLFHAPEEGVGASTSARARPSCSRGWPSSGSGASA